MVTRNTLEDLRSAESYVAFVSTRSFNPGVRARAKVLLATFAVLDERHPEWRQDVLKALSDANETRDVTKIFTLPSLNDADLYKWFMTDFAPKEIT
jgi:hypothetical protein